MTASKPPYTGWNFPRNRVQPSVKASLLSRTGERPAPVGDVAISDHATLRYLERFEGVDVAAAKERLGRHLDTDRVKQLIAFAGRSPHRIRIDGATFCLRDGKVLTCYP